VLVGNKSDNTLYDLDGDDSLDGGKAADHLDGDTGVNTSSYASSTKKVQVDLETNINSGGYAKGDTLTGDADANALDGGAGNDTLVGRFGADTLTGGAGNDVLSGGGSDDWVFNAPLSASSNVDSITDFVLGGDDIVLDNAIFTLVGPTGELAAAAFASNASGSAAENAQVRIIHDQSSGRLYYDADGNGTGSAAHFATLDTRPADLAATDILVS